MRSFKEGVSVNFSNSSNFRFLCGKEITPLPLSHPFRRNPLTGDMRVNRNLPRVLAQLYVRVGLLNAVNFLALACTAMAGTVRLPARKQQKEEVKYS